MSDLHDNFDDLLAVYALDALDPDEAARIEERLALDPEARRTVDEYRATMSAVADVPGLDAPPPELWGKISSQLGGARPAEMRDLTSAPSAVDPPAEAVSSTGAEVVSLAERRARRTNVFAYGIAAAAVAVLGIFTLTQQNKIDDLESDLAAEAAGDPVAELVLEDDSGTPLAVLSSYGNGQWELDATGLPALSDSRAYQLWGVVGDEVVSAGVFGSDPDLVRFTYVGDATQFVLTEEPAGGVAVATGPVVAVSQLA